MSKIVQTTDDKVKQTAASCPDAKRVLSTLFPNVFVDPIYDDQGRVKFTDDSGKIGLPNGHYIESRRSGGSGYLSTKPNLSGVSLYLHNQFDWAIEIDAAGEHCLVTHRKGSR